MKAESQIVQCQILIHREIDFVRRFSCSHSLPFNEIFDGTFSRFPKAPRHEVSGRIHYPRRAETEEPYT